MNVVEIPISELSSDPANLRVHPEDQIIRLVSILKRFGQQLPLIIDANNVVRSGNARLEAARRLGWEKVQVVRSDLSGSDLTAFAIADNKAPDGSSFDAEALAATLSALRAEDYDLTAVGFSASEYAKLIGETNGDGVANDPDTQWEGMPECASEDQTAIGSVKVNFARVEDREAFAKIIGQTVTENTRSIWYPPAPIGRTADKRYADAA